METPNRPACLNHDPEIFFPNKEMMGQGANKVPSYLAENAIRICENECRVREWCLETALRNDEEFGIWGGLTGDQRRALKRRAARAGRRSNA